MFCKNLAPYDHYVSYEVISVTLIVILENLLK